MTGAVPGLRRGHRHRLMRPAVEAALEHDDVRSTRRLLGELDRGLGDLGAGVGVEERVDAGRGEFGETGRERLHQVVRVHVGLGVDEPLRLLGDRLGHVRVGVAGGRDRDPAAEVEVALAARGRDPRSLPDATSRSVTLNHTFDRLFAFIAPSSHARRIPRSRRSARAAARAKPSSALDRPSRGGTGARCAALGPVGVRHRRRNRAVDAEPPQRFGLPPAGTMVDPRPARSARTVARRSDRRGCVRRGSTQPRLRRRSRRPRRRRRHDRSQRTARQSRGTPSTPPHRWVIGGVADHREQLA